MFKNITINNLEFLSQLIDALKSTNSSSEKKNILKQYYEKDLESYTLMMNAVYNYNFNYYITLANCNKNFGVNTNPEGLDIGSTLMALNDRTLSGHAAIGVVNYFRQVFSVHSPNAVAGWEAIINRDLGANTGVTLINSVGDIVPTFDVALGVSYKDVEGKINFEEEWYISRKLDGVRCLAFIYPDKNVRLFSRQGKEFETLDVLKTYLVDFFHDSNKTVVLDGEIALKNEYNQDDFSGVMKEIKKKNHQIQNPVYHVFDVLYGDEFERGETKVVAKDRWNRFPDGVVPPCIRLVKQIEYNETNFRIMKEKAAADNWEGLMLRKSCEYKGKRSKDLIKYKQFFDAEYQVIGVNIGTMPILRDGVMVETKVVSALTINHKGTEMGVGSGMTVEQRQEWLKDPNLIIGKIVTIQYFEETENQKGGFGLRFPVLKAIHGEKREV